MESAEFASWIAAGLAGATFVGWTVEKIIAWRNRPYTDIEIRPIGHAEVNGQTHRVIEIVNAGSEPAYFYNPLIFHGADNVVADGFMFPTLLNPGQGNRLLISSENFDQAYCSYTTRSKGRSKILTIRWYPLNHFGPLGAIHEQQRKDHQKSKTSWLAERGRAQLVGPTGVYSLIATRRHRNHKDRLPIAQQVDQQGRPLKVS